jgi:hypothetical protein
LKSPVHYGRGQGRKRGANPTKKKGLILQFSPGKISRVLKRIKRSFQLTTLYDNELARMMLLKFGPHGGIGFYLGIERALYYYSVWHVDVPYPRQASGQWWCNPSTVKHELVAFV